MGCQQIINIAICDDDKCFISYMKKLLQNFKNNEYSLRISEYLSGEELIYALRERHQYDLLILDMQLGGMDGDETARLFREKNPEAILVFCSGIRPPTDKSFEVTPFRYLLKRYTDEKFMSEMGRIMDEVMRNKQDICIVAHYRNDFIKVKIKNILYIENAKRGSRIAVSPVSEEASFDKPILVKEKLVELEKRYPQLMFAHNSYLVNVFHVDHIQDNELVLDTGEKLAISRAYQKAFKLAFVKSISNKY